MLKILFGVAVGTVFGRPILSFADKALGGVSDAVVAKTLDIIVNSANRVATTIENRYIYTQENN